MSALPLPPAFLGSSVWWMLGSTPPAAMVTGPQQLAELLVVAHGELDVARHDPVLLVVARRVAGQLQHLQIANGTGGG